MYTYIFGALNSLFKYTITPKLTGHLKGQLLQDSAAEMPAVGSSWFSQGRRLFFSNVSTTLDNNFNYSNNYFIIIGFHIYLLTNLLPLEEG